MQPIDQPRLRTFLLAILHHYVTFCESNAEGERFARSETIATSPSINVNIGGSSNGTRTSFERLLSLADFRGGFDTERFPMPHRSMVQNERRSRTEGYSLT